MLSPALFTLVKLGSVAGALAAGTCRCLTVESVRPPAIARSPVTPGKLLTRPWDQGVADYQLTGQVPAWREELGKRLK